MQELLLSPTVLLTSLISNIENAPELILVTGKGGSGKTSWCLELIRQARLAGLSPHGIVSPSVFEDRYKVGIDLEEIQTGKRRRLALRIKEADRDQSSGPRTADWQFDAGVLDWANKVLGILKAGDLLIIDELGPLELLENQGFINGLKLIDERDYPLACVVIRPALLAIAQERWPWSVMLDITNSVPASGDSTS